MTGDAVGVGNRKAARASLSPCRLFSFNGEPKASVFW